jgi:hypothetical protein
MSIHGTKDTRLFRKGLKEAAKERSDNNVKVLSDKTRVFNREL